MNTLKFKKSSWHYHIATHYAGLDQWEVTDLCSYVQHVFGGMLMCVIVTFVGGVVSGSFGDMFAWITAMCTEGMFIKPSEYCVVAITILALILIMAAMMGVIVILRNIEIKKYEQKINGEYQPGFLEMAYESFKEKTCYRIELIDK